MEPKQTNIYQVLLEDVRVMRIAMDANMEDVDAAGCFSAMTNAFNRVAGSFSYTPDTFEEKDLRTGKTVKVYRLEKLKEVI